jgi:demethylmenaquinone methyltransferase/2-methoxy-6-polyprenyl-1,4-benzoquinol methylase
LTPSPEDTVETDEKNRDRDGRRKILFECRRMNKGLQKIYARIPDRYELINHILTLGLDAICRRRAAKMAAADGGTRWLDVCSGTAETAIYLRRQAGEETFVTAADFSVPMLRKAVEKPEAARINFIISDAAALPFHDNSMDLVTVSFATRNINSTREGLEHHFREFRRILKPGGRFVNLETSQPRWKPVRFLMHLYVRLFVRWIGGSLSGSRSAYTYLAASIPRFYDAEILSDILKKAGFSKVEFKRVFSGMAAVHKAIK